VYATQQPRSQASISPQAVLLITKTAGTHLWCRLVRCHCITSGSQPVRLISVLQVDSPGGFGPLLSACPKLESFTSHRLWNLYYYYYDDDGDEDERVHVLQLPKCTTLKMHNSQDLSNIVCDWTLQEITSAQQQYRLQQQRTLMLCRVLTY